MQEEEDEKKEEDEEEEEEEAATEIEHPGSRTIVRQLVIFC